MQGWSSTSLTLLALTGLLSAAFAADESVPLPELPRLEGAALASVEPSARTQILEALRTARAEPDDPEVNGRLGMILHAYQLYGGAAACYERARILDSRPFPWVYYLATIRAAEGEDLQSAAALYREAIKLEPGYLPARLKLGEVLLNMGEFLQARQVSDVLLDRRADSARVRYLAGRVREAQGDVQAAIENYRIACELSPRFGPAHYALGLAYRELGDMAQARQHLQAYLDHQASVPPTEDRLIDEIESLKSGAYHYVNEGKRLYDKGQITEAFEYYKQAVDLNPRLIHAHVNLISIYGMREDFIQAEKHYRAAIELNPDLAEVNYNYGLVLTQQRRYAEAEEAFRRAIRSNPYFADAYNNLGAVLEAQGEFDKAEQSFRQAIENNPDHREAYFGLGRIAARSGRSDQAIGYYLRTLAPEDDKTPVFMYSLAYAYAGVQDFQKARQYAQRARDLASFHGQSKMVETLERFLEKIEQADAAH